MVMELRKRDDGVFLLIDRKNNKVWTTRYFQMPCVDDEHLELLDDFAKNAELLWQEGE